MSKYIPERFDVILLNFEPKTGKEIGKYRPAFVLSTKEYNKKTGLVICNPISTSIRGHLSEVPITNLEKPSVIVSSVIQTLSWENRKTKFIAKTNHNVLKEVLQKFLPLIGTNEFFE